MIRIRTAHTMALALVLLLAVSASLAAQPSVLLTVGGAFDSFRPTVGALESRRTAAGTLNLDHVFAAGRGRVFYDLDAGTYDSPGDWSYQLHETGASYRLSGTDTSGRSVFLTGSLTSRRNGEAWTSANYTAAGGGINVKLYPRGGTTFRAGYNADFRRFADLSALTQMEHRGFASLMSSFQTRTTLVFESQVGAKQYDGVVATEGVAGSVIDPILSSNQRGSAGMVSVMGRIAQSLTDRTGVRLQATARRTFGSVPPLLVTTPAGFFEDGVYDDPFASDGLFLETGVKHVFANSAELAATAWWARKDYTSTVALDAAGAPVSGSPLRWDTVALSTVTWTQPILGANTGPLSLSAEFGYRFIKHRSIDTYYNYTSHALSAGFSISY
jgi:hypothetical protein